MNNPAGCPRFSCGNDILEQAFILAAATLSSNTKPMRAGLLRESRPCLMAGADYPTQWTRDAAINVWFAEALLDPETARNTLLGVLEGREGGPVIGGQYWDRIIWAIGAERLWEVTGDADFACLAYDVLRRTSGARRYTETAFPPIHRSTGIHPFHPPFSAGRASIPGSGREAGESP